MKNTATIKNMNELPKSTGAGKRVPLLTCALISLCLTIIFTVMTDIPVLYAQNKQSPHAQQ
ncbi:MAG: hypothetical protein AB1847_22955, partial [bacterium]